MNNIAATQMQIEYRGTAQLHLRKFHNCDGRDVLWILDFIFMAAILARKHRGRHLVTANSSL
jgi:hypothetical protein